MGSLIVNFSNGWNLTISHELAPSAAGLFEGSSPELFWRSARSGEILGPGFFRSAFEARIVNTPEARAFIESALDKPVRYKAMVTEGSVVVWTGFLDPERTRVPLDDIEESIFISAIDFPDELLSKPVFLGKGRIKIAQALAACLRAIGLSGFQLELFSALRSDSGLTPLDLEIDAEYFNKNASQRATKPWGPAGGGPGDGGGAGEPGGERSGLIRERIMQAPNDVKLGLSTSLQSTPSDLVVEDVLGDILTALGLEMYQVPEGRFVLRDVKSLLSPTITPVRYDDYGRRIAEDAPVSTSLALSRVRIRGASEKSALGAVREVKLREEGLPEAAVFWIKNLVDPLQAIHNPAWMKSLLSQMADGSLVDASVVSENGVFWYRAPLVSQFSYAVEVRTKGIDPYMFAVRAAERYGLRFKWRSDGNVTFEPKLRYFDGVNWGSVSALRVLEDASPSGIRRWYGEFDVPTGAQKALAFFIAVSSRDSATYLDVTDYNLFWLARPDQSPVGGSAALSFIDETGSSLPLEKRLAVTMDGRLAMLGVGGDSGSSLSRYLLLNAAPVNGAPSRLFISLRNRLGIATVQNDRIYALMGERTKGSWARIAVRIVPIGGDPYWLKIYPENKTYEWVQSSAPVVALSVQHHSIDNSPFIKGVVADVRVDLANLTRVDSNQVPPGTLELIIGAPVIKNYAYGQDAYEPQEGYGYYGAVEPVGDEPRFLILGNLANSFDHIFTHSDEGVSISLSTRLGNTQRRKGNVMRPASEELATLQRGSEGPLHIPSFAARDLASLRATRRVLQQESILEKSVALSALGNRLRKALQDGPRLFVVDELRLAPHAAQVEMSLVELRERLSNPIIERRAPAGAQSGSDPTFRHFYEYLASDYATRAVTQTSQALEAGQSISSIPLTQALPPDHRIAQGDTIQVVDPLFATITTFTVSSTPPSGATSISVAPQTLVETIPENSYVVPPPIIHRLKAHQIDTQSLFAQEIVVRDPGYIKSEQFIPGSRGWIIRNDGTAEFESVTIRNATITDASYTGHILPSTPNAYDIGSNAAKWRASYLNELLHIGQPTYVPGTALAVNRGELQGRISIEGGSPFFQIAQRNWGGSVALLTGAYAASSYVNGGLFVQGNTLHRYGPSAFGVSDYRAAGIEFYNKRIAFYISDPSPGPDQPVTWNVVMSLMADRRVGINTLYPLEALHVVGNARADKFIVGYGGSSTGPALAWASAIDTGIYWPSASEIAASVGGLTRLRILSDGIQGSSFTAGLLSGTGWKISDAGDAEFRNLVVRGSFSVYELIVQQMRATNGEVIVTDAARMKITGTIAGKWEAAIVSDGLVPFWVNDFLQARRFEGTGAYNIIARVDEVAQDGKSIKMVLQSGSDVPAIGKEYDFVRISSLNAGRQGLVHVSSLNDKPRVDVYANLEAPSDFGQASKVRARLGNLSGLTWNGQPLSGYGLFSDNAYLVGSIMANSGAIAGWSISQDSISKGDATTSVVLRSTSPVGLQIINGSTPRVVISNESLASAAGERIQIDPTEAVDDWSASEPLDFYYPSITGWTAPYTSEDYYFLLESINIKASQNLSGTYLINFELQKKVGNNWIYVGDCTIDISLTDTYSTYNLFNLEGQWDSDIASAWRLRIRSFNIPATQILFYVKDLSWRERPYRLTITHEGISAHFGFNSFRLTASELSTDGVLQVRSLAFKGGVVSDAQSATHYIPVKVGNTTYKLLLAE